MHNLPKNQETARKNEPYPVKPELIWTAVVWNPNGVVANVQITDVIGVGTPTRTSFVIPPRGVLDLPVHALFFAPNPPPVLYPPLLAMVEFTSDVPIRVATQLSGSLPHTVSIPPVNVPIPTFLGGGFYIPLGGPLIVGFRDYVAVGTVVGVPWLTSETSNYRTNLFVINPDNGVLTLTMLVRSFDGAATGTKTYSVAPHSMGIFQNIFTDPALQPVVSANDRALQGTASATLTGDRPFYAFAGVIPQNRYCDGLNRLAIVQPVELP